MNEPYQRVHKQEDSNNTLYRNIGIDVGIGLGIAAIFDGMGVASKRAARTPQEMQMVKDNFYTDRSLSGSFKFAADNMDDDGIMGKIAHKGNKITNADNLIGKISSKIPVYGTSTTKGRIFNYGTAIGSGLLTGVLRTDSEDK